MTGLSLYDEVDRRRRRRRRLAVGIPLVLAIGGAIAWWFLRPVPEDPAVAAQALATAWRSGDLATAPFDERAPDDVDEAYRRLAGDLADTVPDVVVASVDPPVVDDPEDDPLRTTVTLAVTWALPGDRAFTHDTTAILSRAEDELEWRVAWDPTLVHPRLGEGLSLALRRTTPARAEVLAADGSVLVTSRPVVDVGIEPRRADDVPIMVADLTGILRDVLDVDLDAAALVVDVEAAAPTAFVPVVTLREDDYLRVQDAVMPLPGTVFRRREVPLPPTRDFARFTLGTAGPVTAEMVEEQPDRYVAGDVAGRSGLQAAFDERLFGTPGLQVRLVGDPAPEDPVLFEDAAQPGQPVTVTLDERVQRAADEAVQGTGRATALVAVRPSDGHVLAMANSPEASFDIARTGQVPPGSTFKVVTTQALLAETELGPDQPIACPNAITVGGRTISNAEDQQLGTIPFRAAFANSCNTAFVALSQDLTSTSLRDAAARFGIGGGSTLGLDAFTGDVPETGDAVDLAASAIGQGRILASPLAMAGVAATVANGGFPGLSLVLDPAPEGDGGRPGALAPDQAALLRTLMRTVVTDGTATALEDVPGDPVHGKTGTAEFSADGTLRTHAWFIGFQGDLAFAVVVTDTPGEYGGQVAVPVAARFLDAVGGGR